MEFWHPRAVRVIPERYPKGAGPYDTSYPFRQVIHTTEGGPNYTPSRASYFGHQSWPHATVGRTSGMPKLYQHIPINRAARATKNLSGGVETNLASLVQLEVAWWANQAEATPEDLAELAEDWIRWVAQQTGTKLAGPVFYGTDAGWKLATSSAPQRMSQGDWRKFNGVCGHQHIPENDHWDPGKLDLSKFLDLTPPPYVLDPQEEEAMIKEVPWMGGFPRPSWKLGKGPIDGSSFSVISFNGAPLNGVPVLQQEGLVTGLPWQEGRRDSKGRVVDVLAFGLIWVRQFYDTIGNGDGFLELSGGQVVVQTTSGAQYVIGHP